MTLSQRRSRLIGRLRARKTRGREGLVLVEGVRASAEALDAGAAVSFVVTSPKLMATEAGQALSLRLDEHDVEAVADGALAELADTQSPQGVLLVCREPEGSLARLWRGRYLVLDGIRDPGNAGVLIRGALAFGLHGVICLDGTVDPWSAKTVRASAGMVFRSPVLLASVQELLRRLAEVDVPLIVADSMGEDVEVHRGLEAFALVVGNEGAGVRKDLKDRAEAVVSVPMRGPAESLNVGVAGSILMHTLSGGDAR
jgi:TrmH family RNA methyltransferase